MDEKERHNKLNKIGVTPTETPITKPVPVKTTSGVGSTGTTTVEKKEKVKKDAVKKTKSKSKKSS